LLLSSCDTCINSPQYRDAQAAVTQFQDQVTKDVASAKSQAESEYQKQQDQEDKVQKELATAKSDYDQLNMRMLDYQQAKQEATEDRALYDELVKKIRENEINAGFQNDMVRIADEARRTIATFIRNGNSICWWRSLCRWFWRLSAWLQPIVWTRRSGIPSRLRKA